MSYNATGNPASKRIATLLDEGSFVEIGGDVTARNTDFNLQDKETPSDGVITGYGLIDGSLVYVYSQDAAVLNGAIGEMHAKKIISLYDMAMKMGAPIIGLIDCVGLRLQEGCDALEAFGGLYKAEASASGVIPQITAIFGGCGGGMAMVPGLTDFTFMEGKEGKLFVNSPNALEGNDISKCDTSSASYQSSVAGLVDYVGTEEEILSQIRDLITLLPANNEDDVFYADCIDDLNRSCTDIGNAFEDTGIALRTLADENKFMELKPDYAPEMVIGFMRLNGATVGAVANRAKRYGAEEDPEDFDTVLTADGCKKAADFINFCDAFSIPVLTLTHVTGYEASKASEKEMARSAAKMIYAFTDATVPKVNVIVGNTYGSAYVAMNSKSLGADMVYAWPDAQIGMMDPDLAAKIMYADSDAAVQKEKAAEYEALQSSPESAARRGYVDAIIQPEDTRKYVIGAFEMLYTKREDRPDKKHGTV